MDENEVLEETRNRLKEARQNYEKYLKQFGSKNILSKMEEKQIKYYKKVLEILEVWYMKKK